VSIDQNDVWMKTFKSKKGCLEWLVLPFILTNAPTKFMKMMGDILHIFTKSLVVVYLDDILTFIKTLEEHLKYIQKVLGSLGQHKLYSNLDKCSFDMHRIQYLGYIVDE
jgi:hypothetical protein